MNKFDEHYIQGARGIILHLLSDTLESVLERVGF